MYKDISYAQKRLKQVMEIVAIKKMHKKQVQHVVLILVVHQVHIIVEKMLSLSESEMSIAARQRQSFFLHRRGAARQRQPFFLHRRGAPRQRQLF
jgi:hypothetical protein